jgi:hypothetical protein
MNNTYFTTFEAGRLLKTNPEELSGMEYPQMLLKLSWLHE